MPRQSSIKYLLFDLGGVLLDFAPSKTQVAFLQLGERSSHSIDPFRPPPFVEQFERGEMAPSAFLAHLRSYLQTEASDQLIAKAWCEMLLGFSQPKIEGLRKLSQEKSVALLSNTNVIHWERIVELIPGGVTAFKGIFSHLFLSFEMGMRKPEKRIFEKVLEVLTLEPSEILFIDDWLPNVAVARDCGIPSILYDTQKPFVHWHDILARV